MFEGIILRWRIRLEALVKSSDWGTIAIIGLIVALLFAGAAVFVLAQAEYGTIRALLGFAGLFPAIALLATIGRAVTRRSAERKVRAAPRTRPPCRHGCSTRACSQRGSFRKDAGRTAHDRDRARRRVPGRPVDKPQSRSEVTIGCVPEPLSMRKISSSVND